MGDVVVVVGGGTIYLTLHCHRQIDLTRQYPQTTSFEANAEQGNFYSLRP